ncbi:hypothetical protein VOLCADRAFT_102743 [Volvox carteri f. nagariensis]|uniref:Uncharacterized protein n=1 Tax=Volvox carteri f. nagariensis TaxID=3068 RepID=D8THT0_VOLCA|nr:uncharacterized protein VOLCADRAFT_102743 [Volvox carteri f. nagariensis]EFJ52768.1 hypothetical protein VOLCADRAFT_102743 [Volvox carteri f. nagariensis]|eukprot:XP_002945773.1 hypothetical protein VOLCADRAFT_102743 [Volvox carteri f. nagariensis]
MAAVEEDTAQKQRYSPEEVLKQLSDIPEDKRTFSATKFLQALTCQRETIVAMNALGQNPDNVSLQQLNQVILLFLKNVYNLVSGLPGALMFDALEDLVARRGVMAPFINGMDKADETVVLELGLPSKEALCDSYDELIRIAGAAVVCFYHYTNYPAHPAYFPSDDATLLFTSLALRSCQDGGAAEALGKQLAEAGGGVMSLGEIRWLMHYVRAQLSGLGGAVFLSIGDRESYKQQLVAQQADFLGLIKAVPENPAGYSYYVRTCLQFQQMSAAGLFAAKGSIVAAKHRATFYVAQLAAQRAIALAFGGGGGGAAAGAGGAGEVSAAAKAAVAKAAAAAAAADGGYAAAAAAPAAAAAAALVRVRELRALMAEAREGLDTELSQLPEVYSELIALDPVDSKLLDEQLGPMVQGEVPDEGEVLALVDQLYPTRPPAALPRGAVAIAKP